MVGKKKYVDKYVPGYGLRPWTLFTLNLFCSLQIATLLALDMYKPFLVAQREPLQAGL